MAGKGSLCATCSRIFAIGSLDTLGWHEETEVSLPPHVLNLRLITASVLSVKTELPSGKQSSCEHNLDLVLGNRWGKFDVHGQNFSKSARIARLAGAMLISKLKNGSGEWMEDEIAIDIVVPGSACNDIVLKLCPPGWHFHSSVPQWRGAIEADCPLCPWIPEPEPEHQDIFFKLDAKNFGSEVARLYMGQFDGHVRYRISVQVKKKPLEGDAVRIQELAERARSDEWTGSVESLGLARGWLGECLERHERCARGGRVEWVPPRLLELSEREEVKLVHCSERTDPEPYATLSHCWGGFPSFLITSNTITSLQNGLPFSAFNPTFRDAFTTNLALGLRYIWIDCYCIIQGTDEASKNDWNTHAHLMDRVYANGLINIGATHGANSRVGCVTARRKTGLRQQVVRWKKTPDDPEQILELHEGSEFSDVADFYSRSPLFSRGWIVQERILTPRMLHFTDHGLFWECASLKLAFETAPHGLTSSQPAWPHPHPGELSKSNSPYRSSPLAGTLWEVFKTYSRSKLSFPDKDKSIAFNGIAKRLGELANVRYCNGYFESQLAQELCWYVDGKKIGQPCPSKDRPLRSPSWHWSCSDEPLTLPYLISYSGPERHRFNPLIVCLPGFGPYAEELTRETRLVCWGRVLPVERIGGSDNVKLGKTKNSIDGEEDLLDVEMARKR